MPKQLGDKFILWIFDVAGTVKTAIPTETSTDLDFGNALLDASDKGTGGVEDFIDGTRSWSASSELFYDKENAEVTGLITRILDPAQSTRRKIAIGEDTETGDILFTGEALLESISIPAPKGELMTMSVSFKGVGQLVPSTTA